MWDESHGGTIHANNSTPWEDLSGPIISIKGGILETDLTTFSEMEQISKGRLRAPVTMG